MSHHSALWFWAEHAARGRRPPSRCTRGLGDARAGSATLESLRNLGILRRGRPVDLLVASQGQRRNGSGVRCHCLSGELPRRSFSELAPNVYVCVPELCFLQLAGSHSPVDLLRLGMELCGHYSLAEGRRGFLDRPPLCSRAGLLAYLDAVHATRGVAKARRAAGLVIDGSASPMESSLALLLCLPTRWGGYGLPRPILNGQLTLSPGAARIVGQRRCSPDLSWPQRRVAVEYLGREYHREFGHDLSRVLGLRRDGWRVELVGIGQLRNQAAATELARRLNRHLCGRDLVLPPSKEGKRTLLRESLLPFGHGWDDEGNAMPSLRPSWVLPASGSL